MLRVIGEPDDRSGELYAVDSMGVMLRGSRLVFLRWQQLYSLDVAGLRSEYDVAPGEIVSADKRARLALVSRFPQGLSGPLLAHVLALVPQQQLDSLR